MFFFFFFFFNDTATTEIYTLSLHDALPNCLKYCPVMPPMKLTGRNTAMMVAEVATTASRSEEHTSDLQSRLHLVCRLLLEKKKAVEVEHRDHIIQAIAIYFAHQ